MRIFLSNDCGERNMHGDRRSNSFRALKGKRKTIVIRDGLHDRKPKPSASPPLLTPFSGMIETLEEMREALRRNASPIIHYLDVTPFVCFLEPDFRLAPVCGMLNGI